ncbi:MAG: hypothetical protein IJJ47_02910 [Methanosphaera sp.]|nr:hypothetical protein [Methanosphaera sp.]
MRERILMIIGICVLLCIIAASSAFILSGNDNKTNDTNNTTTSNNSTNLSLNETNNTTNNTTTQTTAKTNTKTSSKKSSKSGSQNSDPDYDPERDASHKTATVDNPITVQQSDGEYTYYGSGHYDYYAGPNHMSGEHYKYMNSRSRQ